MRAGLRYLRVEAARALTARTFPLCVGLTALLYLLCSLHEMQLFPPTMAGADNAVSAAYLFGAVDNFNSLLDVLPVVAALCCATSFCSDWRERYVHAILVRTTEGRYCACRLAACFFVTALAVFLGVCLYLAALAALYPLARPGDAAGGIAFDGLAAQGNYLGALLCRAAVKAVSCGMWGVAALACSAVIPDMLVTVASPLLFKRLYSVLYNMLGLPQALSIDFVSESLVTVGSWQASLLHACGLFLLYAALAGAAYRLLVKRRLRHG